MPDNVKENIKSTATWSRALVMLLFVFIFYVAEIVLVAVALVQLLVVIFSGEPNVRLLRFGQDLGTFIYQTVRFLTYNSEDRPFPFGDWPQTTPS
jgi:Domain of unknown function (DUF4389)